MNIRLANLNDLEHIISIYEIARKLMRDNGNASQWGDHYPSEEIIIDDIGRKQSYVCENKAGKIVGVFCFYIGIEPTYNTIYHGAWLNEEPYGVIHRIASSGSEKGIATTCIEWCINRHPTLRIDTHQNNGAMHHILRKMGFSRCGIIFLEDGSERVGYMIKPL